MKRIGAKLKKVRESQGFSQEYIAECLHVSTSSVSRMETNCATFKLEKIAHYCRILGITLEDLFARDANAMQENPIKLSLTIEAKDIDSLVELHKALSAVIAKYHN